MSASPADRRTERFDRSCDRLLDPDKARRLLQETAEPSGWRVERVLGVEVIKLWPDRRLTVRYDVVGGGEHLARRSVYGKLFRGRRGERLFGRHRWLHQHLPGALDVPEPLGYHRRRRFLLMAELPGQSLAASLSHPPSGGALDDTLARCGRMLAALHALRPPGDQAAAARPSVPGQERDALFERHGAQEELGVLARADDRVELAPWSPATRARFERLRREISGRLSGSAGGIGNTGGVGSPDSASAVGRGGAIARPEGLFHRDLYPQQIIVGRSRCGLVDLDELCVGPGELDLGNLLAHLFLDEAQGAGAPRGRADGTARAILRGYARVGPFDSQAVLAYLGASVLRLATLNRLAGPAARAGDWERLAQRLLAIAEALLLGDRATRLWPA